MRHLYLLGAATAALMIPAAASAQETTATIRGTVVSGETAVVGASVVVTDTATGQRTTATTDAGGAFNATGLRPGGPYTVEVQSASGNLTVTDIFTVVGQPYDVPIDLAVAPSADETAEIVVTASALTGAGTTSDGPQTVLSREQIASVASVNRDIRDLMRRDPFARLEDTASGGRSISFAGVNPRFNRFSIDGVIVSDNFGLNPDANPTRRGPVPYDSIAQFTVSVAPYDIRQGNFLGGAVDAVLLQGTNEFHGTGFYSLNNDELSGNQIGSTKVDLDYKSETYGATLSGPIIKDKLFFMVSGERTIQGNPQTLFSSIPGNNAATVGQVASIANSVYGYDAGDLIEVSDEKDEKIVGKLTWNITDGHRLSASYINAYDSLLIPGNVSTSGSTPSFGLGSNSYTNTELLKAGILQLNSEWSDSFSTEARVLYKYYERGRFGTGENLAQFRVCGDATNDSALGSPAGTTNDTPTSCGSSNPIYSIGTENSTQSNVFFTDTWGGSLQLRYQQGAHDVRLLAEGNEARIFNLFLQNTAGNYYFDSLADFQNRTASSVTYQNTAAGDANLAAADFKYRQFTFGIQDDITVTDRLNFSVALRYDLFDADTPVPFNPGFTSRYGFPNTRTIKGKGLFQPRVSFDYEPIDDLKFRGGVGIFGGGTPDVYLSNSYSNAGAGIGGVGITSVTVQRCVISSSCTTGYQINGNNVPVATGVALLTNVSGTSIPAGLQAQIPNTGANSLANINALDPDFEVPNVVKATLSADWTPRNLLGGGWRFGADYYFSRTRASVFFTDIRSVPIGTLPDGRTRFGPLVGTNTNTDILLTNSDKGRSHIGVVRVSKTFDWGLNLDFAYSQQDVKDAAPATSSTAGSNYGNGAFLDGRGAAYGTANDQVAWSFKYGVGYNHAFFGDYKTRIQLFGETQAGRPFSYTMEDAGSSTRSAVFGVTGRDDRFLLYVPTGTNDPLVSYDSAATQASLDNLVQNSNLSEYRGKIAPRNIGRSRAYTRLDIHLEQEIPTFVGDSRISLFADIENLPNLLNKDWGGFRQAIFPFVEDAVRVQCLSAATPTGTAPGAGVVNSAPSQPCVQYRYSSYIEPKADTIETRRSLYLIRVGARFSF